jgi:hypothetical protein
VTYLASDACTETHRYFSNGAGRYARVFIATTAGWRPDADSPPNAEDIAEHLDEIDDLSEFDVPMSSGHELKLLLERYGSGAS